MIDWYRDAVADFIPSKKRELPEWAQNIFSDSMIVPGNVRTDEEATAIVDLAQQTCVYGLIVQSYIQVMLVANLLLEHKTITAIISNRTHTSG